MSGPDLDAIGARLVQANGLALDESVARWYRKDVPPLLAVAAKFPCDAGCTEYAEETCSRHGRSPADLWSMVDRVEAELGEVENPPSRRTVTREQVKAAAHAANDYAFANTGRDLGTIHREGIILAALPALGLDVEAGEPRG